MKLKIIIGATLSLSALLVACGDNSSDPAAKPRTPSSNPTPISAGVKPAQSAAATAQSAPSVAAVTSAEPLTDGNAPGIPPLTGDIKTDGQLRYIDEKVGDGASPVTGGHVTVQYTGWLTNGTKFDSSRDRNTPFDFVIGKGGVIQGWDIGVATMKIGGKRRLIIPGPLGYGARGSAPKIPPNATLIFDVELLSIQP